MTKEILNAIAKGEISVEKILDGHLYVKGPDGDLYRYDAHDEGGTFISLKMDSEPVENFSSASSESAPEAPPADTPPVVTPPAVESGEAHLMEEVAALDHMHDAQTNGVVQ